ncbi:hypothetical protein D3C72_1770320 [compost metagenome]
MQRIKVLLADGDQRPDVVVPFRDEDVERHGGNGRARQRHDDAPQNLQRRGAVHIGRLIQRLWNAANILAQEKGGKTVGNRRQDETGITVQQPDLRQCQIVRNEADMARDHQGRDGGREQEIAAPE